VLPGATLGALIAIVQVSGLDQVLAAHLYAWQGHTWRLQHAFLTEQLIHIQGRALSLVTWLGGLFIWCMSWVAPRCRSLRRPLAGLLVSTLLSLAILEHWLLVLPFKANALWGWALRARGGTATPLPARLETDDQLLHAR